jgi:hypothetical protein
LLSSKKEETLNGNRLIKPRGIEKEVRGKECRRI